MMTQQLPTAGTLTPFTTLLLNSQRAGTQKEAEEGLRLAEASNYAGYVKLLAEELAGYDKPPLACRMAGLILKNCFQDDRSEAAQARKTQMWNAQVPEEVKTQIKDNVVRALVSPIDEARKSAAQVVAALGVLEISAGRWPQLIPTLYNNATNPALPDDRRIATLEAMGYLCEALDSKYVPPATTNMLLTAIVENMKSDKLDALRLAATTALYNTLVFAHDNMQRKVERDLIVQKVCEASIAPKIVEMRCVGFSCMSQIAEQYYELLPEYMDAFFKLTFHAVKMDEERVALQAIEFWSTLCETELHLEEEAAAARHQLAASSPAAPPPPPPPTVKKRYIRAALTPLVELVTQHCLTKQRVPSNAADGEEEDDWTISMAGACLLSLVAECTGNDVLPAVMPFVQANLQLRTGEESWRNREAALMAFGNAAFGPSPEALRPWITQGVPLFVTMLDPNTEPNALVRSSAAWVIGYISEIYMSIVSPMLTQIVPGLLARLQADTPIVAAECAMSIQKLANAVEEGEEGKSGGNNHNKGANGNGSTGTSSKAVLGTLVPMMLPVLLAATERSDWDKFELRMKCFEAVNAVVAHSPPSALPVVGELLTVILRKLTQALEARPVTSDQKEEVDQMVAYTCGTLLVLCQRLQELLQPRADAIMHLVLRVLSLHNSTALADAYLIVGVLSMSLGNGFLPYLNAVIPHLLRGLRNYDDYEICVNAVESTGDVIRSCGASLPAATVTEVVEIYLRNLANEDLHKRVKPPTIAALGDIALAVRGNFASYADAVLAVLELASQTPMPPREDDDMIDYWNDLRESILETYVAVLQGLAEAPPPAPGHPPLAHVIFVQSNRLEPILHFLVTVAKQLAEPDSLVYDGAVKLAAGLLGDLCQILGTPARQKIAPAVAYFVPIVQRCLRSEDEGMVDNGNWAQDQIRASVGGA